MQQSEESASGRQLAVRTGEIRRTLVLSSRVQDLSREELRIERDAKR